MILVIAILIGLFYAFDLGRYLTLDYIKASQERFQILYAQNTWMFLGGYFLLYVLITSLSLPGAAIMTLAGGGLFGFWRGLLAVSFASTIGATLACAASRHLLGNYLQDRYADKLSKINRGLEEEGSFYLFTLRLAPIFPFFVINLVMGLTRFPLTRFYLVSQIGMLPGTVLYINAGKELARISSPAEILSPGLILSLVLLGLFPIATKKAIKYYRDRFRSSIRSR